MHAVIPYSKKNICDKKLVSYNNSQSFFANFTIYLTFPMQMDFNLPKLFMPNCL